MAHHLIDRIWVGHALALFVIGEEEDGFLMEDGRCWRADGAGLFIVGLVGSGQMGDGRCCSWPEKTMEAGGAVDGDEGDPLRSYRIEVHNLAVN
ncbi:hypothetical protein ACLOJK_022116 [Asimina triloba]